MKLLHRFATVLLLLFASAVGCAAFQSPRQIVRTTSLSPGSKSAPISTIPKTVPQPSPLFRTASPLSARNEDDADVGEPRRRRRRRRYRRRLSSFRRRLTDRLVSWALRVEGATTTTKATRLFAKLALPLAAVALAAAIPVQPARANAPVVAMPKREQVDPVDRALDVQKRKMQKQEQEELNRFAQTGRRIEAEQGEAARVQYEKEYRLERERKAKEHAQEIVDTKKKLLLEKGICPYTDMDGIRDVFLLEKGIDLYEVGGTKFYLDKMYQDRDPAKSFGYQKRYNRRIIKAMAMDIDNRGEDVVEYFDRRKDKTAAVMQMPPEKAAPLAVEYEKNIEEYGQIVPPKEGEISAKERLAAQAAKSVDSKADAKAKKAAERAAAKEAKAKAKAEAKEAKARAKAEAKAAKLKAKEDKAAAAAAAASGEATAEDVIEDIIEESVDEAVEEIEEVIESEAPIASAPSSAVSEKKSRSKLPIVPVSTFVAAVGGGAFVFKKYRDNSSAAEEERQRQMKMLLGEDNNKPSAPALEVVDAEVDDLTDEDDDDADMDEPVNKMSKAEEEQPVPVEKPVEETPKKKRSRLKSVFGKKKNGRETDINKLVAGDTATAPEFAKLLAKILTFGAPGRFPKVEGLPGEMPMKSFELDPALQMLTDAQKEAGLTKEQCAEIFANVVNCMLIDIVDLASSTLKEKDKDVTVRSIGIVVDFMNHAASLYNSIAEGIAIKPVTYGGDLGKGKLEQMYGTYAVSGMTNLAEMDSDFERRVGLLQDVFDINTKRAEGIMMKAMQKNVAEMMKSGKGLEGMEEMMKGFGGMEGMAGLADGQEPGPEELKEMLLALKSMKENGMIPDSEMEVVKKQFREAFGSSIDDVMDAANTEEGISESEEEILRLLEDILK